MNALLLQWLTSAGLDEQRASIYLALLARYECGVTELARDLGFNRTALYDNLAHLERRGFVSKFKAGRSLVYRALPPDQLEAKFSGQLNQLRELIPIFSALAQSKTSQPIIERFTGAYSARNVFEDILKKSPEEYCYISNPVETSKMVTRRYITRWINKRVDKGIRARGIRTVRLRDPRDSVFSEGDRYLRKIRYLPKYATFAATVYIYRNSVGLISSARENETLLINSMDIARTFQNFFDLMWEVSKP